MRPFRSRRMPYPRLTICERCRRKATAANHHSGSRSDRRRGPVRREAVRRPVQRSALVPAIPTQAQRVVGGPLSRARMDGTPLHPERLPAKATAATHAITATTIRMPLSAMSVHFLAAHLWPPHGDPSSEAGTGWHGASGGSPTMGVRILVRVRVGVVRRPGHRWKGCIGRRWDRLRRILGRCGPSCN